MISPTPSQNEVIKSPYVAGTTIKVIAGPGSGKTITLMLKVRELITQGIVKPEEVLILSLTNKAVDNAVHKLLDVFSGLNGSGGENDQDYVTSLVSQIDVSTIHGLANRVVVENEGLINIIEENGWRGLLKLIPPTVLKKYPSNRLGSALTPKVFERLFREYQVGGKRKSEDTTMEHILNIMKGSKVVTVDELILLATKYLGSAREQTNSTSPFTLDLLHKHKVVFVDEFQDLFPSLLPFLESICRDKQLIMFGDPHQSIYGFLGDNKTLMRSLERARSSKKMETYYMRDNFRCTPEISKLSSCLKSGVFGSTDKDQAGFSKPPMGLPPLAFHTMDPAEELETVTDNICQLVSHSVKFSDIAVLTRTNAQLKTVGDHLKSYGIPLEKLTAQPDWMTDKNIRYFVDLLKVCILVNKEEFLEVEATRTINYQSDFSIIVTLSALKGISNQAIQALFTEAKSSSTSLWQIISKEENWSIPVANKKKIKNYVNNVRLLKEHLRANSYSEPIFLIAQLAKTADSIGYSLEDIKSPESIETFKDHLTEMLTVLKGCALTRPDNVPLVNWFLETHFDQSASPSQYLNQKHGHGLGSVKLSTIHSSKGLEFPVVFLLGGGNSDFPIEKNALYVGITRARNILYLGNVKSALISSCVSTKTAEMLKNEGIWKYYNLDLGRPYTSRPTSIHSRYNLLNNKYGLKTSSRAYATLAVRASHILRYIIK
ncbi:LANO_0A05490g1_1 [Lachancea nothofagi CBS 11611]|uniref:DNA 3'-5' helicase n=1 Tax=Lachancea nothofagi CBS 11611 TaxID=1266666 RepID=A0A1G4IR62_9SACH|nr:LANO_0A05490g1_1 [Lachancea nothofagi CBS 11611]